MNLELTELFSPDERQQLWRDVVHDFTGQSFLGASVWLTGHRWSEAGIAFVLVLAVVLVTLVRHRIRRRKLLAARAAAGPHHVRYIGDSRRPVPSKQIETRY